MNAACASLQALGAAGHSRQACLQPLQAATPAPPQGRTARGSIVQRNHQPLQHRPVERTAATATAWRVRSVAGAQQSAGAERQGDWLISASHGYVEKAVAISRLLAEAFASYESLDDETPQASRASVLQYQLKLLAALQWRASTLGRGLVTITAVEASSGHLAGVANVTPGLALAEAGEHVELAQGEAAATISNMAVAEPFRRRGLGRRLLAACEAEARRYSPPASLAALIVFRYNEGARALYESSGYELDETWQDMRWIEDAERGRVAFARRQLMLKRLD